MPTTELPRPTEAELEILRVLWDRGPSTVKLVIKGTPPRARGGRRGSEEGAQHPTEEQPATPTYTTLRTVEFTTLAWTKGTNGVTRGPVIWMPENDAEYAQMKEAGKLKGAWVLVRAQPPVGNRGVQSGMST